MQVELQQGRAMSRIESFHHLSTTATDPGGLTATQQVVVSVGRSAVVP